MSSPPWLGRDEHDGVPSQTRPDKRPPDHWRLAAIYATERPHHLSVSPDGSQVAFVLSSGAECDIYVIEVGGGQARRLSSDRSLVSYWEDSGPEWSPDGSHLAYTSGDHVYVVPASGGVTRRIDDVSLGTWLDDQHLVVLAERDLSTRLALVAVDDPWPRPFGPRGGDVNQVRATGDSRVTATFWPKDDLSRLDVVVAAPDGDWKTLVGHPDRRAMDAVTQDGRVAYAVEDDEWRAVYLTDLDGSDHQRLAGGSADFGSLTWSKRGDRLAAIRSYRGQADLVTIDLEGVVDVVTEGGLWQSPQWSGDDLLAVYEAHDTAPHLVRVTGAEAVVLYDGAPAAVSAASHAPLERVVFSSQDGLDIEGFLFRPAEISAPVPAVVYPHGGPTSMYGDEWDGHAQYFVDKGYAWFAINFRGSTTYGRTFERANHNNWGVGDTEDCLAAGRYLASLDWVDGNRIAIFGASYGSYMALTALVHPDNPFACGVSKYGDCNILTSWAQGDRPGRDDLERMMDHPARNRGGYHAGSPIHRLENLERPILIAHGERDARVHPKQADELVAQLKRLGKGYEYVTYPEEGHGFLRRASQIDFYERLERFLDWYLM
jgi:dipeptidyl aminopeptidase/acylaminoacyl peptidase